ncbi:hypothetical protein [Archaeoglobus sp.]
MLSEERKLRGVWTVHRESWNVYEVAKEVFEREDPSYTGILEPVWDGMNWMYMGFNNWVVFEG